MNIFKLPDLGEGLPEAIVREWYVKEGESVAVDQPVVAVETAKALVDVPAPFDGKIEKLFADIDQTLQTGAPLIGFEGDSEHDHSTPVDAGTVVGHITQSDTVIEQAPVSSESTGQAPRATAEARTLARRKGIHLNDITPQGDRITKHDINRYLQEQASAEPKAAPQSNLSPNRQAMVMAMQQANEQVAHMTVHDDAIISAWFKQQSLLLRSVRATVAAVQAVPIMNSHFHSQENTLVANEDEQQRPVVHLGIAIDTEHGLVVPVIKNVQQKTDDEILTAVDTLKTKAQHKSLSPEELKGATIVLSNFGSIAAKYATPIVTPPTVAIVGVGRVFDQVGVRDGNISAEKSLPLSVSADHRVITGGEVIRFLAALIHAFEQLS